MTLLLIATHLAAFALGALACNRAVLWFGKPLIDDAHISEDTMADDSPPTSDLEHDDQAVVQIRSEQVTVNPTKVEQTGRRSARFVVILIIASLIVIVIGGQAYLNQKNLAAAVRVSDHQRACQNQWARDLTDTITTRADGNSDLRAAEAARDDSIDGILRVIIAANGPNPPPPAQLKLQFQKALGTYSAALANLTEVRASVDQTITENPYPQLDLDCTTPEGGN